MVRGLLAILFSLLALTSSLAVELRLTVWDSDVALDALRRSVSAFEAANPGIKVKLEPVPYGNYQDKLLTQVAARVAPDVAMMNPENFQRYARREVIWNLNEFAKSDPEFKISEFYPEIIEAMSLEGNLYVLPRDIAPIGLIYYNKRLFDEAGIPYPNGSWTWDFGVRPELKEKDFLWTVDRLTQKSPEGKTLRYGFAPGWPQAIVDTFVYSQGARYVDDPVEPTELRMTDPRIIKSYELAREMAFEHRWMPSQVELQTSLMLGVQDLFVQQKTAMFLSGIWEVPGLREKLKPGSKDFFEWDIVLVPAYKDGKRAMPTGGAGYCVLKQTKHPEAAWKLAKWMAGPFAMNEMAKTGLAQPAIAQLARQSPWVPSVRDPIEMQYPPSRIITDAAVANVVFNPTGELYPEIVGLVNAQLDRIWLGTTSPKTALESAQKVGTDRLKVLRAESDLPAFSWPVGLGLGLIIVASLAAWVYWPERGRKMTQREKQENRTAYLFIAPWLIGLVAFTLGPMVLSLLMSFADWDVIRDAKFRGVANYTEAFTVDPRFYPALKATFIYTAVSVPLGLCIALGLALLLNSKVFGMPVYRTLFYLPSLASGVASALIWKAVFRTDGGLLNSLIYGPDGNRNLLGLAGILSPLTTPGSQVNWLGTEQTALPALIVMSVWGAGAGMVVLLAGLQGIPEFYYEAARVDGAGPWTRFRSITLPMLSPALLFTLITGLIGSFQVFTQAFVMTGGGPGDATRFYMLHLYDRAFVGLRMGYSSALAWILFLIIVVFTALQLRMSKWVYYEAAP